jgi:hypothetical protein
MMNFSPFFAESGGLVTAAGLDVSFFSGVGVAAHINPRPKKRAIEMARRITIDLLNFVFILPPSQNNIDTPLNFKWIFTPLEIMPRLRGWNHFSAVKTC